MDALRAIDEWPVEHAAVAVVRGDAVHASRGDGARAYWWASVTKLATALAVLVAVEEGVVDLDGPAGPEGATLRHLLAHASGLPPDGGSPLARPGERRIYSNAGFETLAEHVANAAKMPFGRYLEEAVFVPLAIRATFDGAAASGIHGGLDDLTALARELLRPTLVAPETLHEATEVAFPGLVGVLPGFGRQTPNDWGLGFELRDGKRPHWTGRGNSARTFGHFGAGGTFLWVDPEADAALACLTDRRFAEWPAAELWPALADEVLAELG